MRNADKKITRFNRLVRKLKKGDLTALDSIYDEYGGLFFNYAKKYLYDKSYAEDLLSEVFCKLIKNAEKFDFGRNGLNWAIKIIKNEAINHNIKEKQFLSYDESKDITTVFDLLEQTENNIILSDALKTLGELERRILYEKFWEGLTVREIAENIGKPPSTTQDILKKALSEIEKKLNPDNGNENEKQSSY